MLIKKDEATAARRTIYFTAVQSTDDAAYTGALAGADLRVSKAGGAEADSLGTATHIATGLFKYEFTAGECDTVGEVSIRIAKADIYNDVRVVNVVAFDPHSATSLGLSNLDTTVSSRSSHTVSDIWDLLNGVEAGLTPIQALRGMAAMLFGKVSGAGSGREVFRSAVDDRDALTITNDTAGNRTSVTRNL